MRRHFRFGPRAAMVSALVVGALALAGCATESGDPHSTQPPPPAEGPDSRIRDVGDPARPDHPATNTTVAISGAVVLAVDTFDETRDGKSIGTIYVQDVGSQAPFAGISLFAPSFNPGNLRVGAGDVLDLKGPYTESTTIGTTVAFAPGSFLPQLSRPTASFRYEFRVPEPVEIDVNDLADFAKGRRWINMLVKVKNVKLFADVSQANLSKSGRLAVALTDPQSGDGACATPFPKAPTLTNELFDSASLEIPSGTTLASVTGLVTFFCNLHLSPQSSADIVR